MLALSFEKRFLILSDSHVHKINTYVNKRSELSVIIMYKQISGDCLPV